MKPFKTYSEQVEVLKNRGLIFRDESEALRILERENYYNLINGYKVFFLDKNGEYEKFKKGTTFEDIHALYSFDRELRSLLLKYLLTFETILKSRIAYRFAEAYSESHSYLEVKNYSKDAKNVLDLIAKHFNIIRVQGKKHNAVSHYLRKYEVVPLWVIINYMSFGHIQYFYTCIKLSERDKVAKDFSKEFKHEYSLDTAKISPEMLDAIIKTANYYRNVCAHEDRLYNFKIQKPAKSSAISKNLQIENELVNEGNLFSIVSFLKLVTVKKEYLELLVSLEKLFIKYDPFFTSMVFSNAIEEMGFPSKFKEMLSKSSFI